MSRRLVSSDRQPVAQTSEARTVLPFADSSGESLCPVEDELAVLAEFAAGAGHEINNPLSTILGRVELVLRRLNDQPSSGAAAEMSRDLRVIAGQAQRIRDMIGDLMLFARPPKLRCEVVDLRELAWQAARPFQTTADERRITLNLPSNDPPAPIAADPVQVKVVIAELLRNAFESLDSSGSVTLRIAATPTSRTRLVVEDTGRGLTSYERQHLFHPFYSGRNAGRGLGFGLCKCWRILAEHGGDIEIRPRTEGGTAVITDWPTATATSASGAG